MLSLVAILDVSKDRGWAQRDRWLNGGTRVSILTQPSLPLRSGPPPPAWTPRTRALSRMSVGGQVRDGSLPKGRPCLVTDLKSRQSREATASLWPLRGSEGSCPLPGGHCWPGDADAQTSRRPVSEPPGPTLLPVNLPAVSRAPRPGTPFFSGPGVLRSPTISLLHGTVPSSVQRAQTTRPNSGRIALHLLKVHGEQGADGLALPSLRGQGSCGRRRPRRKPRPGQHRQAGCQARLLRPRPALRPGAEAQSSSPCAGGHQPQHPGRRNLEADAAAGDKDRAHCCLRGLWMPAWPPRGSYGQEGTGTLPMG